MIVHDQNNQYRCGHIQYTWIKWWSQVNAQKDVLYICDKFTTYKVRILEGYRQYFFDPSKF